MSDIAPLVVAILRDKTVTDLMAEILTLKQTNDDFILDRSIIQVTSLGGTTSYWRGLLSKDAFKVSVGRLNSVVIGVGNNGTAVPVNANGKIELELRVSGVRVHSINDSINLRGWCRKWTMFEDNDNDGEEIMGEGIFGFVNRDTPGFASVFSSPMSRTTWEKLWDRFGDNPVISMEVLSARLAVRFFTLHHLAIPQSNLSGCIALMEKIGYPLRTVSHDEEVDDNNNDDDDNDDDNNDGNDSLGGGN